MMNRPILIFMVLAVWLGVAPNVQAQSEDPYAELVKATKYASAGALSRSVKHFERVLKLAPKAYPLAYFNLAEVYRAKKKCDKAVLLYEAYARKAAESTARGEADAAIKKCGATAQWVLEVDPETSSVYIDGYLIAEDEESITIRVVPQTYTLEVSAVDHLPSKQEIAVSKEGTKTSVKLDSQTFFGSLTVSCATKGAKVRVFEGASAKTKVLYQGAPFKEAMKLKEGKHFVEVVAPGFDTWIRNVRISRDDTQSVTAKLTPARAPELD